MSRKINAVVGLVLLMCLWTGCGSSSSPPSSSSSGSGTPPVVAITANTGATQSTAAGTPFPSPLSVTVTVGGSGMSGEIVTFTAPSSGASGTFANGTTTDVELTNAQGQATAAPLMANPTGGSYTVTAAVKNTSATTSFSLTNVSATFFSFYLSGQESATYAYYALAGSVVIDAAGNVWGGEQDYNDGGNGLSSPEPAGDQITGGSLTFPAGAPAGQGTLTLNTTNLNLGPNGNGVEVFAVQFVNSSHALISQFDGLDTSSGSLDAQTLPSTPNGNFAFAMSGSDSSGDAVDFGGVFSVSSGAISGLLDINDYNYYSKIETGKTLTGTLGPADGYGRGKLTGIDVAGTMKINYYVVGPEAIRLVDVDASDAAIGSAFGQGQQGSGTTLCPSQPAGTFCNASLGSSVLQLSNSPFGGAFFAGLGQFATTPATGIFSGYGDVNEPSYAFGPNSLPVSSRSLAGTYSIGTNGYGSLTVNLLNSGYPEFGDFTVLGVYMTDPALNLEDPNNSTGGGGALVIDLSANDGSCPPSNPTCTNPYSGNLVSGATGVIVPQQTSTLTQGVSGNYAAAWQNFNSNGCGQEFDMLAQGSLTLPSLPATTDGTLSLTGMVSDPFLCLGTPDATSSSDTFTGTPAPDATNAGRYTIFSAGALSAVIDGQAFDTVQQANGFYPFRMVMYQASPTQLFWLDYDSINYETVSTGPLEQQGTLPALPAGLGKKAPRRR